MPASLEIPRRSEVISRHKERGGRVAAVFPIHYPRALFRAFNVLPVEVWGPPKIEARQGEKHLQSYTCSIVRNGLSFVISGGLNVADFIVVPHACDSLQGFGSILIDFIKPEKPVIPIYIPRGTRESDIEFFTEELKSVFTRLAEAGAGSPSDPELIQAIEREEEADKLLQEIFQKRTHLPFSDIEFYRLVRAREYLPGEEFIELARDAVDRAGDNPQSGIPIILSGIVPEPMEILNAIVRRGGVVVADDFACLGRRLYPAGKSEEPRRRMAESIILGPPDSTRGSPIGDRVRHLRKLVEESGARGVVFYNIKFCEPELFHLPILRKGLKDAGIPSVVVEADIGEELSRQVETSLETFMEVIK
ncbi:MAG: 2-hydroxyacyl-CoA dehydratase [Deltaproteobacteria bacterium]|nr:MAG: 2-hydroxyacyl-CoA dehydratase [Deltaproteobacteria bacterium]